MSSLDQFAPGAEILNFRLGERIGSLVWRAEDLRGGRPVALKILTRQLPAEPERREDLFKHVRLGAALVHPFLVPVIDVVISGDLLLLVMELVEAKPLARVVGGKPRSAAEVFAVGYQVAEVLRFLHLRDIVHGNVNSDSVLIGADGHVRLAGLNLPNLLARKEGAPSPMFQQKGSDARVVAYLAPEQVTGQPVDFRTDVFSAGVAMYELATGALPWGKSAAPEIARVIVEGQPQSPRVLNPAVDASVMDALSRCLPKDPNRRHKDGRALAEDLARLDPAAVKIATELVTKATAPPEPAPKPEVKESILMLADVDATDPDVVRSVAAKMQQILGEAAYLFDGHVVDPFGNRLVAEMPNVEAAMEAGRKGEFDLVAAQREGQALPVRLLLHAGVVEVHEGEAGGEGVARGFSALPGAPHRRLILSEDFARHAQGGLRLRDAGARGGVKLFEIAERPREKGTPAPTEAMSTVAESRPLLPPSGARKRRTVLATAAGLALLIAGSAGVMFSRHRSSEEVSAPVAVPVPAVRDVAIEPFSVEGAEPALLERASAMRLAVVEILRATPDVRVAEKPSPSVPTYHVLLKMNGTAPELSITRNGRPLRDHLSAADNATAIEGIVTAIAQMTRVRARTTNPTALNAFSDALAARSNNDPARAEVAIRAAIAADANFLPLQLAAMDFFASSGKDADAVAAAKQVALLAPSNLAAQRLIARSALVTGDLPVAIDTYGKVLRHDGNDIEALNAIGRLAYSAADARRFAVAATRLTALTPHRATIHAPDLLTASGKFEEAIQQYYDIEVSVPDNPSLSLKIGKIAVLRHTPQIAQLEVEKLSKSDPDYGIHILKAYVAAGEHARGEAESELALALKGSRPGDDYWTSSAEVYAILGDPKKAVAALQSASDRHEPTISYVLANPLFRYIGSDAKFQQIRATLSARQVEIRAALEKIAI